MTQNKIQIIGEVLQCELVETTSSHKWSMELKFEKYSGRVNTMRVFFMFLKTCSLVECIALLKYVAAIVERCSKAVYLVFN